MKRKKENGITLIALVITITVILILAGITISVGVNQIVKKAKESAFSTEVSTLKDEYTIYISEKNIDELGSFDKSSLNLITYQELKKCMPSIKDTNYTKYQVISGKLAYVGDVEWEIEIARKLGLEILSAISSSTVLETYEEKNFVFNYSGNWKLTSENPIAGLNSYRSMEIDDNSESTTEFEFDVKDDGKKYEFNFDYKVDSEYEHDYFYMYINGEEVLKKSGNMQANESFPLITGKNKIKFVYKKDESISEEIDAVYIDNLWIKEISLDEPKISFELVNQVLNVKILYPDYAKEMLYAVENDVYESDGKLNKLDNWMKYNGNFSVESGSRVFAKYVSEDDIESPIASLYIVSNYNINEENYEDENLKYSYEGDWERTSENPIEGNWSFRSKNIGDNKVSSSKIIISVPDNGFEYNLYFNYFVNSESADIFRVIVNNITVLEKSGEEKSYFETQLKTGNNEVEFKYVKDGSASVGLDLAMIDNLKLSIRSLTAPIIRMNKNNDYTMNTTVIYPDIIDNKLYSIDEGNTWNKYLGPFKVDIGTVVYAKYINALNEESEISSLEANYYLGSETEDFETEKLIFNFVGDWYRTKDYKIDGRYSFRSKEIGDYGTSNAEINITIPDDGTEYNLYFEYLVSSENNCDTLIVKVNEITVLEKSGEEKSYLETPLKTGENKIVFQYKKDGSSSKGFDIALIDNVRYYQREKTNPIISCRNANDYTLNVSILYPNWAVNKLYSIDDGATWKKYSNEFNVQDGTIVYAKYINGIGEESNIVSIEAKYSYGTNIENFETTNLIFNFIGDWYRTKDYFISDRYSFRSANIGDSSLSTTTCTIDIPNDGSDYTLYFKYKVSSENSDKLIVKVNDITVLEKSGEVSSYIETPLKLGKNEIVFQYKKDGSVSVGLDLAMIDDMQIKLRKLSNPIITHKNANLENKVLVSILYPSNAYKKEYSLDGDVWNNYTQEIQVDTNTIIYARYKTGIDEESSIVSKEVIYLYGSEIETFETENRIFELSGDWYRNIDYVINERYSLRSNNIGHSSSTSEIMKFTVPNDGYNYVLYFKYRVSSENNYDKFTVFYKEKQCFQDSGEKNSFAEIDVNPGENEITFTYSKDGSGSSGDDLVLLDDIQVKRK